MTSGGLDSTVIDTKQIIKKVVEKGACSIILVHNHPSGDPKPSAADLVTTRKVIEVGKAMELPLLDHVIIGAGGYTSLKKVLEEK